MESGNSEKCGSCLDFGFGFNDANFSDRTLAIELIIPESTGSKLEPVHDSNGNAAAQSNGNLSNMDNTETQAIHINSLIIAAKSPFFHKLFSNGMSESNQRHVTLRIQESEEAAFMDVLKFMYSNKLSGTTQSDLLDVLVVADKYEVVSCMQYCLQLLKKLPVTCQSSLLYLDLPSTILMDDTVRLLIEAAKQFLVARFKDISKFQEEMLDLPLAAIEIVLSSDDLCVDSEDEIYDFVMKWARRNYTEKVKRREMLITRLLHLIRFPFMSSSKLKEVLTCTDINMEHRSKLVFDAISLETPHRQLPPVKERERAYNLRPVTVIRFDSPRELYKVYLNLKREECVGLLPSGVICSRPFYLGGQEFYLITQLYMDEQSSAKTIDLFLGTEENGSLEVGYKFSWREKPSEKFVCKYKTNYDFVGMFSYGHEVPWDEFIADDSRYFINGVFHFRVVLKIKKQDEQIHQPI